MAWHAFLKQLFTDLSRFSEHRTRRKKNSAKLVLWCFGALLYSALQCLSLFLSDASGRFSCAGSGRGLFAESWQPLSTVKMAPTSRWKNIANNMANNIADSLQPPRPWHSNRCKSLLFARWHRLLFASWYSWIERIWKALLGLYMLY